VTGAVRDATRRTKRVSELIRHELGRILAAGLNDPRIGFVTLTRVSVTADLRTARVFVSVLGPESKQRLTLRGLKSARRRLQAELGRRLTLRHTPQLSFQLDTGPKQSVRISALLNQLSQESAATEAGREPSGPPQGPSGEDGADGQ